MSLAVLNRGRRQMTTDVWTGSGDWFTGTGWSPSGPPASGDTAVIEGTVTITPADAAVAGQGTLDGITVELANAGTVASVLDMSNEQFGSGMLIDTPFGSPNNGAFTFFARGTTGFAGTLDAEFSGNTLTLDIESNGTAASFTNTGLVEATGTASLSVIGTSSAAFLNDGVLAADTSAQLDVATTVTNSATATIDAASAAALTLAGSVLNQGTIYASAAPGATSYTGGTVTMTGSLDNTGSLYVPSFAVISATGGVANSGSVTVAGGTLTLGGGVTNSSGISVAGGTLSTSGAVTNEATGTVAVTGFGLLAASGTLTNLGVILASESLGGAWSPGTIDVTGSLVNQSTITVSPFGTLAAGGGMTNSGSLAVGNDAAATIDGGSNSGNMAIAGAATIAAGFTNAAAGTIAVSNSGSLAASGSLINQGLLSDSAFNGTSYLPGTITDTGSLDNSGSISVIAFGSLSASGGVTNSGTITDAGGTVSFGGGVTNSVAMVVSGGSLGITGTLINSGTITDAAPGAGMASGTLTFSGDVANSGVIADTAGTVTVAGSLTGTGTVEVSNHLTLAGAVGSGQVIDFGTATDATLDLGNVAAFAGTIANFSGHDIIDINAAATGTTYDATSHVLTVLNGTSAVATIAIASGATAWNAIADGQGGSVLTTETIGSPSVVENYMVQNSFDTIFPAPNNTPETHGWVTPNPTVYYTFQAGNTFTPQAETAFVQGMSLYSDFANINFATADATHTADLTITTNSGSTAETTYSIVNDVVGGQTLQVAGSATISIDTQIYGWQDLSHFGTADTSGAGGYGFLTVLHELGHAIGFGHPGPYNDGLQSANFLSDQIFYTDTRQYSVMSYIDPTQSGASWQDGTVEVMPQTPMMYDIGAAQMIYGANTSALGGNDTFGFSSSFSSASPLSVYNFAANPVPVVTLYDAGANNTLDLSGFSAASYVNLNAGAFSSADGLTDNIGIAAGTTINSAVGGSGNDVFTLNAQADTINGGGGVNTVVLSGPSADYTVIGNAGTVSVTDTLNSVTDTLTNIQLLQFSNATGLTPCFLRGTLILTARGEVAVEALRPGADRAVTRDGRLAPVAWVGWRAFEAARHPRPADAMPVRVRAGAIAPGQPRRDLLLSPDHALALDGVLIPVRYLINGASVVQEDWHGRVAYYHVELDRHDVLLAEGLPAESYLDTGNRDAFTDRAGATQLHPRFAPSPAQALRIWADAACAPLIVDGPVLAGVRDAIAARIPLLGFGATDDPALCVATAGRTLPLQPDGDVWTAGLPEGTAVVRLQSRCWTPLHTRAPGADERRLGVAIGALWLDGVGLALDDARLGSGWHAPEGGWRWTDGAAELDVRGARRLTLRVVTVGRYWIAPEATTTRAAG